MAASQCQNFAGASVALRQVMTAVDPDISAEYDEELGEVNKELGFDFEKDFLANIGQEWSFAMFPEGRWALSFTVKDMDAFKRHAARLAGFGKEPWEATKLGEREVFKTKAYTIPLVVACQGDLSVITSSEDLLEQPGAAGNRPVVSDLEPFAAKPLEGETMTLALLWRPKADPKGLARLKLPREFIEPLGKDAAVWLRQDAGAGYARLRFGTLGITQADLRNLVGLLLKPD
jgi:hypothetical protein